MSAGIEVFVFKGSKFLGSRCFSSSTLIIGRGRDAGLKLQDPAVEERHAMVRLEGGDLVIADSSQSGITVNGQPCRLCRLSSLDEVAIGPFRVKLSILGQEDDGFGTETSASGVSAESSPGTPTPERDDATLPRLSFPGEYATEFDEQQTHAGPSALRPVAHFSAADRLGAPGPLEDEGQDLEPPAEDEFVHDRTTRRRGGDEGGERGGVGPSGARYAGEATRRARQASALGGGASRGGGHALERDDARPLRQPARDLSPARKEPARNEPARNEEPPPVDARATTERNDVPDEELEAEDSGVPTQIAEVGDLGEEPFPAGELQASELQASELQAGELQAGEEDDEDEDEEEVWEEPFSLLENIVRERFKTPIETEPYAAVEVIHYADNEIIDLSRANPGQTLNVGLDKFELIKLEGGRALLYFNRDFSGTLVSKGKARTLKAFCNDSYLVDDELYGVVMQEGDYAQVLRNGTGYLVRFVKPPLMPRSKVRVGLTLGGLQALAGSVAVHFLLVVVFAVLAPEAVLPVEGDSERFAKVSLKDLDLEKAVKEEKSDAKKEEPKQDIPQDVPKETPKIVKRVVKERVRVTAVQNVPLTTRQKERAQKKAVASVMTALENLKPAAGASPGRSDLKALASNISAVRSPAGASASFRVSGVIGRIGGDGVRLAGGFGGGGKDTRVGGQLLSGGSKIGQLGALAGTGTKVRGRVSKAPARAVTTSGGQCDRSVIQNVVGGNMASVQACYERVLLSSPGLAGKIVFDWTIAMGGGVSNARMVSSSMTSPAVATCILALIRTWRFSPCPIGGPVEVRYPFVFRVSGF